MSDKLTIEKYPPNPLGSKISDLDYHLEVQICSPLVRDINMRSKYNSVLFVDYSPVVEDILYSFKSDKDLNLFRFELYTLYQDSVKIKKYSNGHRMSSDVISVSPHSLAICLPRYIRRRFFIRDSFYEKYLFNSATLNTYCYL